MSRRPRSKASSSAFTLVEMLVVVGIIVVLIVLAVPAVNALKNSNDITAGSYDIAGALETARSYAMANNTYTWVGFFEEDARQAKTPGIGRVVISIVSANDGVQGFDPNSGASGTMTGSRLSQVGKLIKVGNTHLAAFDDGSGDGMTFDRRPIVGIASAGSRDDNARIGDSDPPAASFAFLYPLSAASSAAAQYTFNKIIQFDPQGESRLNSTLSMKPVVEIGLRPTRGNVVDARSKNTLAIQLSGVAGMVKVYRK